MIDNVNMLSGIKIIETRRYSASLTSGDDKSREGFNGWYLSRELARLQKIFSRRFFFADECCYDIRYQFLFTRAFSEKC